jgi:hypothetical protein
MNYGELKQEILDIAKLTLTDTVGARVARFVARAEGMIASKVRALEMIETGSMLEADRTGSSAIYNAPARCRGVIQVSTSAGRVERVGLGELARYNTTGAAAHSYTVRGGGTSGALQIEFRPAPPTDTEFDVLGFYRPAALTDDTDEHGLLTNHEALYIHGALHWLYLDAHQSELASAHLDGFNGEATDVNAVAKEALRAVSVNALEYNHSNRSAM